MRGFFHSARVFSNFHLHPVRYLGFEFPSNENAYQWAKSCDEARPGNLSIFQECSPSEARRLGGDLMLRPGWDESRVEVMLDINLQKYRDPYLHQALLDTDNGYLEETNWWHDNFWGACWGSRDAVLAGVFTRCPRCTGHKHNMLGQILMEIRDGLRSETR